MSEVRYEITQTESGPVLRATWAAGRGVLYAVSKTTDNPLSSNWYVTVEWDGEFIPVYQYHGKGYPGEYLPPELRRGSEEGYEDPADAFDALSKRVPRAQQKEVSMTDSAIAEEIERVKDLQAKYYPGRRVWKASGKKHIVLCAYFDEDGAARIQVFAEASGVSFSPHELYLEPSLPDGMYIYVEHDRKTLYARKNGAWYRFSEDKPTFYEVKELSSSALITGSGRFFRIENLTKLVEVTS